MTRRLDLTGRRYGRLTVLRQDGKSEKGVVMWLCRCDCGTEVRVQRNNLQSGNTKSCGCHRKDRIRESRFEDVTGRKFGKLTCLEFAGRTKDGAVKWLCLCECGRKSIHTLNNLKRGHATSCGCVKRAISAELARELGRRSRGHKYNLRHGQTGSPTWISWQSMISRCTKPNARNYHNYGGRGIKVCDRWLRSFEAFLSDMGERPPGHTLGRIDNNGNYEPGNCEWQRYKQQNRNRRNNHVISFGGESKTIAEWSEQTGIPYGALRMRIKYGWSIEKALKTPVERRGGNETSITQSP